MIKQTKKFYNDAFIEIFSYQVKRLKSLNSIFAGSTILLIGLSIFSYFFQVYYSFTVKLIIIFIISGLVYVAAILVYHQIIQLKNKKFDPFMMPFFWFGLLCVPIMIPNEIFQVHKKGIMILGGLKTLPFIITLHNILFIANHISKLIPFRARSDKSSLTEEDILTFGNLIEQVMNRDKPYLDPDLTLKGFSGIAGLPVHYVSRVINTRFKENFSHFINRHRINEAKRQLVARRKKKRSILEIAFQSGFNSKSVFNTYFKKFTGMTPREYREGWKDGRVE